MNATAQPRRSFRNRKFWCWLAAVVVTFAIVYPFSPVARQQRRIATMRLFFDHLNAEWLSAGRATVAPLRGGPTTSVHLHILIDRPVDDLTWAELLDRVRAKRNAYRRVSPISILVIGDRPEQSRQERFEAK